MKNVANWTIGSFFRTLGRIIAYIIVGAIIAFAFSYNSKAATLTSKSIFTNNSCSVYNTGYDISSFGSNNTYSFSDTTPSVNGSFCITTGNIGSTISGKSYLLGFGFTYSLYANKYYDITINFKSNDLRSNVNTTSVSLFSGDSTSNMTKNYISLIGITNNATTSSNTNKLVIRIFANSPTSIWAISISEGNNNITSVNNFGISTITIEEVDTSNSQEIINNQTNNTQNIINNQNNTTQEIINNQNELLGQRCENLLNKNDYIIDSDGYLGFKLSNLQVGKTYTLSSNQSFDYYKFSEYLFGGPELSGPEAGVWSTSATFTITDNSRYLFFEPTFNNWITNINQLSGYNLMLVEGSTAKSYCEYGSYSSKLDETNNAINDVNDTINNDNVDGATDKASNFFSNFTTNTHGLTSIITSPLSAIQSLTNATCSPLVLPLPYVNRDLILPCMREIYVSTFGDFMTLYDTITLGIISYWVLVRIFTLVKDFKNPEHDEVEVMDL